MKELRALNKFFLKYKYRLGLGILFVTISNFFAVLPPVIIRTVIDQVYSNITLYRLVSDTKLNNDYMRLIMKMVMVGGLLLITFALIRGVFMFFMRQTIIVMSRHIEYDQKNEIYEQYQRLSTSFFKSQSTGDLMSRMSEDVSRVRMYTGPAIMYTLNFIVLTILSIWGMFRVDVMLSLCSLIPLPLLAFSMIRINGLINKKSSKIQAQLGKLTALAQESFSGIRVIKSFVQEDVIQDNFETASKAYRKSTIGLAKTEAWYTPLMGFFIGISLLITILLGGMKVINGAITVGNIAEFIFYITMLTFPVSTLGWTSSMIQRAAASQKRINEFLVLQPEIQSPAEGRTDAVEGAISFKHVDFVYPHTGIKALSDLSLEIKKGQKIAILGKTGSGKSSLAHLLLRMYDTTAGTVSIDGTDVKEWDLERLRKQISYVPQEVFLFSDTIARNIAFGVDEVTKGKVQHAAQLAHVDKDIMGLREQYDTVVGERGVMLSGGQKQRVSIARALLKPHEILILDDSISAVDTTTEQAILRNLKAALKDKTVLIITHRIFKNWDFDQIVVLDDGKIAEIGTHDALMLRKGFYYDLYQYQVSE
ncbi:ABC transporter [Taibaiella sp. KBW10]|uniref:ABC transporter ATP-binding protein n=1 Tax=Taibaiella sp. KBW10 TaxID=2153357 RepID=UPI000F5ADBBD|nr:ABC transporter ATP-binding protein [Taibaiella sp. KBW10]RQO30690.1 ABC transporter [Taibaiella sp. KBW10]